MNLKKLFASNAHLAAWAVVALTAFQQAAASGLIHGGAAHAANVLVNLAVATGIVAAGKQGPDQSAG
jgi:hypothetical protein